MVFFRAVCCTKQLYCSCRMVFRMFLAFLIFDPNWPICKGFARAIVFARWPIFQTCVISLIFNWYFLESFFGTEQLYCSYRMVFRMFFAFLSFDPNWRFCKRYSLCMVYSFCKVANSQTCLISPMFGVFSSHFLHRTTLLFL